MSLTLLSPTVHDRVMARPAPAVSGFSRTLAEYRQLTAAQDAARIRYLRPSRRPYWCWECRRQLPAHPSVPGFCSGACAGKTAARDRES